MPRIEDLSAATLPLGGTEAVALVQGTTKQAPVSSIVPEYDTAANLTSDDPTLAAGQLGIESDSGRTKVGDGSTAWTSLNYIDSVETESGAFTVLRSQQGKSIAWTVGGSDVDADLPDLADGEPGDEYEIVRADSGVGIGTVAEGSGDSNTIEGTDGINLVSQYDSVRLRHMGTFWKAIALQARFSTGWVANNDWTDMDLTVTHGLGTPLSNLTVSLFLSTDGTEANSWEVKGFESRWSASDDAVLGWSYFAIGDTSFKLETGGTGIAYVEASGARNVLDTESYQYKIVVDRFKI